MVEPLLQIATGAPKDYEDFYLTWRLYARGLVVHYLPDTAWYERNDIADTLCSEFVAMDYLNPDVPYSFTWRQYVFNGEIRLIQFKTFFRKFCLNRIYNLQYHTNRSFRMISFATTDDDEDVGGFDPPCEQHNVVMFMDSVMHIKKFLDTIPVRKGYRKNLSALFMFIVKTIAEKGSCSLEDIALEFHVTTQTACWWLNELSCCSEMKQLV